MSGRGKQRKSVLIVEDEPAARMASERYLVFVGYEVATAANASEAMELAEKLALDVVVCDWRLGDGETDGATVARQLQAKHHVPVIFVSAHSLEELEEATSDMAVSRIMRKPVQLSALAKAIDESTAEPAINH